MEKFKMSELIRKVKTLPIDEVIEQTLNSAPSRSGMVNNPNQPGFLCPFHGDHNGGNFHIFFDKKGHGKYHCFVCDESVAMGDAVDFVKNFKKCSFNEALLDVAVGAELISKDEYQREIGKTYESRTRQITPRSVSFNTVHYQNPKLINLVYSLLAQGDRWKGSNSTLSQEDLDYLHGRGILDKEISFYGYFTMPSKDIVDQLVTILGKKGYTAEDLIGVPGFFLDKTTNMVQMVETEGIGIPLRNAARQITAIQIRARQVKPGQPRYRFFSSSFTQRCPDIASDGCGPSRTISVVYPAELLSTDRILITEGQFKAAQFAMRYGSYALTVQGVNNTKDVIPCLEELQEKMKGLLKEKTFKILIGFDMDMYQNVNVLAAAFKLRASLEKSGYTVYYLNWDPGKGKGLDDCLLSGGIKTVKATNALDFEKRVFIEAFRAFMKETRPGFKSAELNDNELVIEFASGMKQRIKLTRDEYISYLKLSLDRS